MVRAEIIGPEDTIDAGQLRLRSRHRPRGGDHALERALGSFLDADDELI